MPSKSQYNFLILLCGCLFSTCSVANTQGSMFFGQTQGQQQQTKEDYSREHRSQAPSREGYDGGSRKLYDGHEQRGTGGSGQSNRETAELLKGFQDLAGELTKKNNKDDDKENDKNKQTGENMSGALFEEAIYENFAPQEGIEVFDKNHLGPQT